ncbi:hypothetical protein NDU88_000868 [Pleurodeles waltl]|uniref:Uncharacterized protein n=1 Tax=Pleurodeles waltl TaxID=8319 RepID=A0AAV7WGR2_PLEWA|nr:hypothetical protein NDU88_000868 [Pleurodeles waltl]
MGLRRWRSLESSAPEGPAREPRSSAQAQAAGALNRPAALPESERSGGTPGSSPAIVAARMGLPRQRRELWPLLPSEAAASQMFPVVIVDEGLLIKTAEGASVAGILVVFVGRSAVINWSVVVDGSAIVNLIANEMDIIFSVDDLGN